MVAFASGFVADLYLAPALYLWLSPKPGPALAPA
jgi:hypothetical protein